jgi:hypothetical protein
VLRLEVEKLLHHGCQFLCHNSCKGTKKERNYQEFRPFIISCLQMFTFARTSDRL